MAYDIITDMELLPIGQGVALCPLRCRVRSDDYIKVEARYPDLPRNTPNNSQIVRLPNREDSLHHLASIIPGAFSPAHYTTSNESCSSLIVSPDQLVIFDISRFIETSTPEPEEEKEVTPEPSLVNTPEEISSAYEKDVEIWEQECRAHKRQLLRYLGDNGIPLNEYDLHYQQHYGGNYDGDEDLTEPEFENEIMAA
ncbi:hypothetical protein BDD12DRAFT_912824 [Trichophaea hybrida]|nr:hypothetical protein BDD12DRAFT_912824 [Trichophaea hybrida]